MLQNFWWFAPQRKNAMVAGTEPSFRQRWRVPICTTESPARSVTVLSFVQLHDDLARDHDIDVDGRRRVHAGAVGLHVLREPRELRLELCENRGHVALRRRLARRSRRQGEEPEAEAADRRKVAQGGWHRAGAWKRQGSVRAPDAVEFDTRKRRDADPLHALVRHDDRTAAIIVPGHDSPCVHAVFSL